MCCQISEDEGFGSANAVKNDQWLAIADIILPDPELCAGEFLAANGKARYDAKWQEIAWIANSVPGGARKSAKQWRMVIIILDVLAVIQSVK